MDEMSLTLGRRTPHLRCTERSAALQNSISRQAVPGSAWPAHPWRGNPWRGW